jgi:hypothetical protein
MQRTFLVTLEVDFGDPSTLAAISDDIEDDLSGNFEIVSVVPWGAAGTASDAGALGAAGRPPGLLG